MREGMGMVEGSFDDIRENKTGTVQDIENVAS